MKLFVSGPTLVVVVSDLKIETWDFYRRVDKLKECLLSCRFLSLGLTSTSLRLSPVWVFLFEPDDKCVKWIFRRKNKKKFYTVNFTYGNFLS